MLVRAQLKGIRNYHGGRRETIVRENVEVHCGWLATSSNRRDWLFVQDVADMSEEGVEFYGRLNNLGVRAWRVPAAVRSTRSPLTGRLSACAALDFPDAHLRQTSHEEAAETMLKKLRNGEYTGKKPAPGKFSEMYPPVSDGHAIHTFLLHEPAVLAHMARAGADPQDLGG